MTPSYNYNPYPTPYQYQNYQPLTCQTLTPTVALGQQASFSTVVGAGQGGTYNWSTAYQNFPNVGPTLTTLVSGERLADSYRDQRGANRDLHRERHQQLLSLSGLDCVSDLPYLHD